MSKITSRRDHSHPGPLAQPPRTRGSARARWGVPALALAGAALVWTEWSPRVSADRDRNTLSQATLSTTAMLGVRHRLDDIVEDHLHNHVALSLDAYYDVCPARSKAASSEVANPGNLERVIPDLLLRSQRVTARDVLGSVEFNPRALAVGPNATEALRGIVEFYSASLEELRQLKGESISTELRGLALSGALEGYDPLAEPVLHEWVDRRTAALRDRGVDGDALRARLARELMRSPGNGGGELAVLVTHEGPYVYPVAKLPESRAIVETYEFVATNFVAVVAGWAAMHHLIDATEHASALDAIPELLHPRR